MTEQTNSAGQVATDSTGTTAAAPGMTQTASVSQAQTTGNGSAAEATDTFFDYTSIAGKPELEAAYKQMQGSYTKRMQELAQHRTAIDAYQSFQRDPKGTLTQLAQSYGLQLVERGQDQPQDQNFQSWDDVKKHFFNEFQKEMLQPVVKEVQQLKKQNIEAHLDSRYPDWRTYEDQMMDTLRAHPSLVQDPDKLYRLSVPEAVWEARATNRAMQKLKAASDNAQVSGGGSVKQTTQKPTGPLSFDQAVQLAKQKLLESGHRAPSH